MPAIWNNGRDISHKEMLKSEWIVLVGEAIVTIGSIVVIRPYSCIRFVL